MSGKYSLTKIVQNQQRKPISTYSFEFKIYPSIRENLKQNEIKEYKRLAQEKLRLMEKRKKAVIKIQKCWRGYITRLKFNRIKPILMKNLQDRLIRQYRKEYIKKNAKYMICNAIYNYILKKRNREKQMMIKFVNHCAVIIQKHIRRYLCRKKFLMKMKKIKRLRDLLLPVIKGYIVRKILSFSIIKNVIKEIKDMEILNKELEIEDTSNESKKLKEDIFPCLKSKKIKLINYIKSLSSTGSWVNHISLGKSSRFSHTSNISPSRDRSYDLSLGNESHGRTKRNIDYPGVTDRSRSRQSSNRNNSYRREKKNEHHHPTFWESKDNIHIDIIKSQNISFDENFSEQNSIDIANHHGHRSSSKRIKQNIKEISRSSKKLEKYTPERSSVNEVNDFSKKVNTWEKHENMHHAEKYELNPWELRENTPVGPKKGNVNEFLLEEELKLDDKSIDESESNKKVQELKIPFLKKKIKYDPIKAIKEAKKKLEAGNIHIVSKKNIHKTEESNDIMKTSKGEGGLDQRENQMTPNSKRQNQIKKSKLNESCLTDPHDFRGVFDTKIGEDEGNKINSGKKYDFLKRKSKAVQFHKIQWERQSRIDCWAKKSDKSQSRSYSIEDSRQNLKSRSTVRVSKLNQNTSLNKSSGVGTRNRTVDNKKMMHTGKKTNLNVSMNQFVGANPTPNSKTHSLTSTKKYPSNQLSRSMNIQSTKPQPQYMSSVNLSELEKAFNANFVNKFTNLVGNLYIQNNIRGAKYKQNTSIPILKSNSQFIKRFKMEEYKNILIQLNKQYEAIQASASLT